MISRRLSFKTFFIITIACVLLLSSFFVASYIYHDKIPVDVQRDYHQISENIQSTDENVSVIELSNKIILSSDSKEPTYIKIFNPGYKTYQINHYDDNGDLIETKIMSAEELNSLLITNWSTYEIIGIDDITYGDGWTEIIYSDGHKAHKLAPTNYLRWDGEWRPKTEMNMLSGDWSYLVEDLGTYYLITRLDDSLTLSKIHRTYDFQPYKIGVTLTLTPAQLNGISTYHNVGGIDYWYITIPQSLKQTVKHLNWDNKLPVVTNNTLVNYTDVFGDNYTAYGTINQSNFDYRMINGEFRFYYNQDARAWGASSELVIFEFNSYIINSSTNWVNTSYNQTREQQATGYNILEWIPSDAFSHWTFDNNSFLDENITNGNDVTNTGTTNNDSGRYGEARDFSGNDVISTVTLTDNFGYMTLSAWIYVPNCSVCNGGRLFDKESNLILFFSNESEYTPGYGNNDISFYHAFSTAQGQWYTPSNSITENTWHHVLVTYDNSNVANNPIMYIDGVVQVIDERATPIGTASTNAADITIGNRDALDRGFVGSMDDVRIWNRILSQLETNQTRDNYHQSIGNVTHWHDAGSGYQGSQFKFIFNNNSNSFLEGWVSADNSTWYQVTDNVTNDTLMNIPATYKNQTQYIRAALKGNTTTTPELIESWIISETSAAASNITSWQNNKTNNNTLDFTINTSEEVNFNATANQTITTWNWYKDDVDQSHNYDNITLNWSVAGLKHVIVNATNANGTSSSITWNVTVQSIEPTITLLSQIPSIIYKNSTGYLNISYGISHDSSGLNNTSVSFIYRNYDWDLSDSNHSIRPPSNNLASVWNFNGRILRGANRNETPGLNFENNATITGGDIYTWSGLDENSTKLTIVPVNSTYTKIYINGTVHCIMPQMWYLDRTDQQQATKTQLPIHKTQNVLIKFWNFEIYKGNTDFLGVGYTDTSLSSNPALWPSDANPVNFYYVNSSYDPATGGDPITSGYAVYMGSLNASGWVDYVYSPHTNSNYVRGFIDNNYLHTIINTTNTSYLYFTSNTESSKPYYINMTNVASSTNRSFANTNTLWAGNTPPYTPQAYTPNFWVAFMKLNMSLDHKLYAADNNDLWGVSSMNRTNITQALFPPTTPTIDHFHFLGETDYDMDGVYYGNFSIGCGVSTDPDGGDVTHNLTLHYANNLTFVTIINNTFTDKDITHNGVYFDANFSSIPYYSQTDNYTLRLITTDDESETVTVWLNKNFSLDGSPRIISYSPDAPVSSAEGENQTFSITTNLLGNVTWYIDSVEVFNETSVNSSSYSNNTALTGVYNVTVVTTNTNGSNSMTWDWTVESPKYVPLSIYMGIGGVILIMFISSLVYVGIPAIFTSFLGTMLAFINSVISVNGQLVQNISGIDSAGNVVQGTTVIEVPALCYLFIFFGLIMAGLTIYHIAKELQYKNEKEYVEVDF